MLPDEVTDYIRALVDQAPPLSFEQRSRLASLLRPTKVSASKVGRVA